MLDMILFQCPSAVLKIYSYVRFGRGITSLRNLSVAARVRSVGKGNFVIEKV